jgi:hypothetical protein
MYYVVTDFKVYQAKSRSGLNKLIDGKIEDAEMVTIGEDKIVYLNPVNLDFVQDKKRMSQIPMSALYKADIITPL